MFYIWFYLSKWKHEAIMQKLILFHQKSYAYIDVNDKETLKAKVHWINI
jgi:hypothetical protein